MLKHAAILLLTATLAFFAVACNESGSLNQGHRSATPPAGPTLSPPDALSTNAPSIPLAIGQTFQFSASARYGVTTVDATASVTWISDDPSVSIDAAGLASAMSLGTARIHAELGGVPSPERLVEVEAIVSILVTSPTGATSVGLSEQFAAVATLSPSGTLVDVTDVVDWTSSDDLTATVGAGTGLATGVMAGSVTITATDPNTGVFGSAALDVEAITGIVVAPTNIAIIPGLTQQFSATATLTPSGATVNATNGVGWSSDAPGIVSIGPATGLATGLGEQLNVTITATDPVSFVFGTALIDAETLLAIDVVVNGGGPAEVLTLGTLQLDAIGTWSLSGPLLMASQAAWSSSDPAIATVNATGLVTGVAPGVVTITAAGPAGSGVSGALLVNADDATFLGWVAKPTAQTIAQGGTLQYVLMEEYSDGSFLPSINTVTGWSTSPGTFATIDGAGLLTAVSPGTDTVRIDFTDDNGQAAFVTTTIIVTATDLIAPTVASVFPANLATEVAQGVTVRATFSEPLNPATVSGATFTVGDGVGPIAGTVSYNPGTLQMVFTPAAPLAENTIYTATITVGVTDVAGNALATPEVWTFTTVVDGTPPTIVSFIPLANAPNVALTDVVTVTFSEDINPATLTASTFKVNDGTADIAGTIGYSAGTFTATFTPTPALVGNTIYQATVTAGVTDTAPTPNALANPTSWLFATEPAPIAITISGDATVVEGLNSTAFVVSSVTYSNGATAPIPTDITWSVTNGTGSATVNPVSGVVTGVTPGTVTVRATHDGTGVTASRALIVLPKTLIGLTVGGAATVVEGLTTAAFTVTGATYNNGNTAPIPGVTWSVVNGTGTATINGTSGVATGVTPGTVTVVGTNGATGVTGSVLLTVVPKTVASLTISGAASVVEGLDTLAYTLTGVTYNNGDTAPTPTVTWGVANGTGTATANGSTGVVTGVTPGTVTVTATHVASGVVSNGITLTVLAKTVTSLSISGNANVFLFNFTIAYTVTGVTYDNGDTSPIPTVTWSALDVTGSASMDPVTGIAKGLSAGTVTIRATEPSSSVVSNSLTLTVLDKLVTSLTIAGDPSVVEGLTTSAYAVTAVTYDNLDTTPIPTVAWNVAPGTGSATINSGTGVLTGITPGTVTVTATEPVSSVTSNGVLVNVVPKTLQTLTIGGPASLVQGVATAYAVTSATYDNGSTTPLPAVNWSVTSGSGTASVVPGTGVLTGINPGTVTLTGTNAATSVQNSIVVTVLAKTVTSITIGGDTVVVEGLNTTAYAVTGVTYDNGNTSPIPTVTWSVINGTGTATVIPTTGVVTGVTPGAVTVRGTEPISGAFDDFALTVVAKTVTGLTISGAASVVQGLDTAAYTVTAVTYDNGTTSPIPTVNWSVVNGTGTATINSSTGVATGGALGTVTVRAQEPSSSVFSNGITLTVVAKTLTGMTVDGDATVAEGLSTAAYTIVAAAYNNGDTTPLPTGIVWSVTNGTGTATINSSSGVATGVTPGSVTVTATHPASGVTDDFALNVVNKSVTMLTISGDASVYETKDTAAYTVTGVLYDNGTTSPIPAVSWSVTNGTGTATVNSSSGVVTGGTPGTVTVRATHVATGTVSNGVTLTVLDLLVTGLTITGDTAVLVGNSTAPYTIFAVTYNNGDSAPNPPVVWSVTPVTGSATINSSTGVVTAVSAGDVTVKATNTESGTVSNSITLTIGARTVTSFTISGASNVYQGASTAAYTVASVLYSDASTSPLPAVTWSVTSGTGSATINPTTGVVTGVGAGTVTVSAQHIASVVFASNPITLTVDPKVLTLVTIDQGSISTPLGLNPALTATGTYSDLSTANVTFLVNWASTATGVATVGLNSGLVTTKATGSTSITATAVGLGAGGSNVVSLAITLTVDPAELASIVVSPSPVINALPLLQNQQFTATGTNTDGTTAGNITNSVNWNSTLPGVATIDAFGLATPVAPGTTVINATDPVTGVVSQSVNLTVVNAVVDSVAVTPDPPANLPRGLTQQFTAVGTLSDFSSTGDISTSVTWTSSNPAVATVSGSGLVTAIATGSTNIRATAVGAGALGVDVLSPLVPLTVVGPVLTSLTVSAAGSVTTVPQGASVQLSVIGTLSDGSTSNETNNVTWVFAGSDVSINASGLLTGLVVNPTPTAVAATLGAVNSDDSGGSITMQVVGGSLTSIQVTPSAGSVFVGATLQFRATGNFADGSSADITPSVDWASSTPAVATVNASGLASAVAAGSATISATDPVSGVSSTQPGGTSGAMTVTAAAQSEGSAGSPLPITPPYTGQVQGGATNSYYVISGLIPGLLYRVTQTTLDADVYMELWNNANFNGTRLCYSENFVNAIAPENCVAAADGSGQIYVRMIGQTPQNNASTATFGISVTGPILSPYWVETFQNAYNVGGVGRADTIIEVYHSSDTANALGYNDDGGSQVGTFMSGLVVNMDAGQTYYVKVTRFGTNDGGYSIKVNNVGFIAGDAAPNPAQFVNEPNDTPGQATALTLNTQSDNALTNTTDLVDWFVITIP